jgi:hypothetical protein
MWHKTLELSFAGSPRPIGRRNARTSYTTAAARSNDLKNIAIF